jgi:RNA polymerase sigma factor (sigma-70 family)
MTPPPFQRLLDEHATAVWRLCVASVGRVDADDVFQDTLLAALRAWPRLPPQADVRAWVLTVAHRKALDLHRARSRRPIAVGTAGEEIAAVPAPDPDDDLWAAVRALPPGQRAAVTLRYAGDLRPPEVAAALGITEAAARRRVADGLARLREELPR